MTDYTDFAAEAFGWKPQKPGSVTPAQDGETDFAAEAFGWRPQQIATKDPATAVTNPNAEPDAATWLGRRVQDVRGKRDPRYQGVPTVAEQMLNEPGNSNSGQAAGEMGRWLAGASDDEMGTYYKNRLGSRFVGIEKDANNYPVIRYKGQDGRETAGYVNQPGLDMQDVVRGVTGVAPYVGTGRVANALLGRSGARPAARIATQGATAGATSIAQDAAGGLSGVTEIDPEKSLVKAGFSALGGAAGEGFGIAGGALYRKFMVEPRYFDKSAGRLTPAGEDALRSAGVEPEAVAADFAQQFAREMARSGSGDVAASSASAMAFKIPRTRGEVTGDYQKLLREQQMTGGTYGRTAKSTMEDFRSNQNRAITDAVRGEIEPGVPGIAGQLAPGRVGDLGKDAIGANVRASTNVAYNAAREVEKEAWESVPKIMANKEALAEMPGVVAKRLDGVLVDEAVTPSAARMAQTLDRFMAGKSPVKAASILPSSPVGDVNVMRKTLLGYYKSAATSEDKRAAGALYDSFNDWVGVAAEKSGNPTAAAAMVTARGISRKIHDVFDGQPGTAGARIMRDILGKADSAEGVVNTIFSAPGKSEIKNGAVSALGQLKRAYDTYLEPQAAKAAWDDMRLAYWMRLSEAKTGDVMKPQALASAIKNAEATQGSIMKLLYTPQERLMMARLSSLMEQVSRRNPNTSWSAIGVGQVLADAGNALLSALGANSVFGRTVGRLVSAPLRDAHGSASAAAATGSGRGVAPFALPAPSFGGYGGGSGSDYSE